MYWSSLVVDTENDASAEKRGIFISPGSVVVVSFIPKALARDAHALMEHLPDNALNDDFVTGDAELLSLILNINDDGLGPLSLFLVVELLTLKLGLDAAFNDIADLSRVESLVLTWLHPVGGQMSHARVTEVDHILFPSLEFKLFNAQTINSVL